MACSYSKIIWRFYILYSKEGKGREGLKSGSLCKNNFWMLERRHCVFCIKLNLIWQLCSTGFYSHRLQTLGGRADYGIVPLNSLLIWFTNLMKQRLYLPLNKISVLFTCKGRKVNDFLTCSIQPLAAWFWVFLTRSFSFWLWVMMVSRKWQNSPELRWFLCCVHFFLPFP